MASVWQNAEEADIKLQHIDGKEEGACRELELEGEGREPVQWNEREGSEPGEIGGEERARHEEEGRGAEWGRCLYVLV